MDYKEKKETIEKVKNIALLCDFLDPKDPEELALIKKKLGQLASIKRLLLSDNTRTKLTLVK